jgi:hypothetical protein
MRHVLYRDPQDGRLWELTYPHSDWHGGEPPDLRHISSGEAASKYGTWGSVPLVQIERNTLQGGSSSPSQSHAHTDLVFRHIKLFALSALISSCLGSEMEHQNWLAASGKLGCHWITVLYCEHRIVCSRLPQPVLRCKNCTANIRTSLDFFHKGFFLFILT